MTDVEMSGPSIGGSKKVEITATKDNDLYMRMKDLESQLEMLQIQEDYLKDEQRHLKSEYVRSKEEVSTKYCLNQILYNADQENSISTFGNRKLCRDDRRGLRHYWIVIGLSVLR